MEFYFGTSFVAGWLFFKISLLHRPSNAVRRFFRERGFHPGKSYLCWGNLAGYPSQQQVQCTEDGQCENRNDEEEAGIAGSMEDLQALLAHMRQKKVQKSVLELRIKVALY